MRRHHRRRALAVLTVAVVMAGCGGTDAPPGEPGEPGGTDGNGGTDRIDGNDTGTDEHGDVSGDAPTATRVRCGDIVYNPDTLADAPPRSELPEGPADAVDDVGDPAFDDADIGDADETSWRIVRATDDRVELLRELDDPQDLGDGDVRTHEVRVAERITGTTNVPDGTWMLTASGPCTPRVVLGNDLGEADLTLAADPSPDARTLELLVHERACASGQPADGRIEVVSLDETPGQVRLLLGVRPLDGAQTCPSNPPTPFTVELAEPLGTREVVDASVVPARPLRVGELEGWTG